MPATSWPRLLCAPLLLTVLFSSFVVAESPIVDFDVVPTVAIEEVTSPDFPPVGDDEKLIAIRLQVSTYVSPHQPAAVDHLIVTFDSPAKAFQIVDFLPQTALDTPFAGPVVIKEGGQRQIGLDIDPSAITRSLAGVAITGKISDSESRQAEFSLLPPKEVVAASGTIHRGRGVYFKLRPSSNETIEGSKEFLIVARVPASWRGDLARLRCTASGQAREPLILFDEPQQLAQRDFLLGLHLAGDEQARRVAERFVAAEQWLRTVSDEHRREIDRDCRPRFLQKVSISAPSSSLQWLPGWLYGRANPEIAQRLPEPVREAALQYAAARSELHALSGERPSVTAIGAKIED